MHTKSQIKNLSKILFSLVFSIYYTSISFAQTSINLAPNNVANSYNAAAAFCPHTFNKNLSLGIKDSDVKVLQQILNTDSRTIVAQSGIASPGNETDYYGVATRDTVKRFQALFIEYIAVANGNFGPKTRTVMNAVCNSEYFLSGRGNVYSGISTQNTVNNNIGNISTSTSDNVAPSIYLRSNSTGVDSGTAFRIIVTASEPILAFTNESIIIENGTVSDLRKLSPNSYSLLVTPNEGAKYVVAQVEADKVVDLAGNKNQNASNEIKVTVNKITLVATTTVNTVGIATNDLDNIFNKILASVSPTPAATTNTQNCTNGATNYPNCNNNNNNNYNSGGGGNNNGQNSQQGGLMNMLMLSSLLGGNRGGGGLFGGGGITGKGYDCNLTPNDSRCGGGQYRDNREQSSPSPITPNPSDCLKTPKPAGCDKKTETIPGPNSQNQTTVPNGGIIKTVYNCPVMVKRDGTLADIKQAGRKFFLVTNSDKEYTGLLSFKSNAYTPKQGDNFVAVPIDKMNEDSLKCCEIYDAKAKACKKEVSGTENKTKYWPTGTIDFSGNRASDINNTSTTPAGGPAAKTADPADTKTQPPQTPEQPKAPATPEPKTTQQIPTESDGTCQLGYRLVGNFSKYCEKIDGSQGSIPASIINTCPSGYTRFKDNSGNFNCRIEYITGGGI